MGLTGLGAFENGDEGDIAFCQLGLIQEGVHHGMDGDGGFGGADHAAFKLDDIAALAGVGEGQVIDVAEYDAFGGAQFTGCGGEAGKGQNIDYYCT